MGDVTTGDSEKAKRYTHKYSPMIREYVNQSLNDPERKVYDALFNEIKEKEGLTSAADLMQLDITIFDFIRIKRLHKHIHENGDMIETELQRKDGSKYTIKKANEASYLLNAVESQFRQNSKELLLTRKEQTKKALIGGSQDLASWMSNTKPVEVEIDDKQEETTATD